MSMNPEKASLRDPLGWFWEIEYIPGPESLAAGREYSKETVHNILTDEGERNLLDSYFRNLNNPPTFFVGLHSGAIAEADTLAQIVEPSQAGYGRKELTRNATGWPTLALDAGDFQATAAQVSFVSAFTSWLQVNRMFLASQSTGAVGSVILEAALSIPRTLASQDTLNVTAKAKAQ